MSKLMNLVKGVGIIGVFCVAGDQIMKFASPSREEILKTLPEEDREIFLSETRADNMKLMEIMKNSTVQNKPIWEVAYDKESKDHQGQHKG
eukprot:m.35504 g.35504  ORF g.35504 m.35504 type:complete len:91 (+) comp17150_c0_seq2:175-447(+)